MAFKINNKTRIKISSKELYKIIDEFSAKNNKRIWFFQFLELFYIETGLVKTSYRRTSDIIYYFKITDYHKYMIAKIKYDFF